MIIKQNVQLVKEVLILNQGFTINSAKENPPNLKV